MFAQNTLFQASGAVSKQGTEDIRKLEEEKRLSGMANGKSPGGSATIKKGTRG